MVGAAGRNAGKTTFACSLIERFKKQHNIIAVKVTTIQERDGRCPRGGEGCGVCTSLTGDYCLTEEAFGPPGKDTTRLLKAGANRVFWLRVMKAHLKEGMEALVEKIGPGALVICESNSLRQVVSPGLFLMVRKKDAPKYKNSARAVKDYADKTVLSDGTKFDFDFDALKILDNRWILDEPPTAVILAGGLSRRMGSDKCELLIQGRSLMEHIYHQLRSVFDKIIISSNEPDKWIGFDATILPDKSLGHGPLMGIATCLEASKSDRNFFVACDIPDIDLTLIKAMLAEAHDYDGVVPTTVDRHYEPLFAVYRKRMMLTINAVLGAGGHRIKRIFPENRIRFIELDKFGKAHLKNLNTKQEYEEYQRLLRDGRHKNASPSSNGRKG